MINNILLILNALACGITALRLMLYRCGDGQHHPIASWCAYLIIISSASVTIRILAGDYVAPDGAETLTNIVLCAVVLMARGNRMWLVQPMRSCDERTRHT